MWTGGPDRPDFEGIRAGVGGILDGSKNNKNQKTKPNCQSLKSEGGAAFDPHVRTGFPKALQSPDAGVTRQGRAGDVGQC